MLKNPIIKVHFHGVEVQIQHIPDNHIIVNINGTSTLIHIKDFQTYRNVEQNVANDTNKNVEAEKIVETNLNNANSTSVTKSSENISENIVYYTSYTETKNNKTIQKYRITNKEKH